MILWALLSLAGAQEGRPADVRVWADTAGIARPNLNTGDPYGTVAQRVGLSWNHPQGWGIRVDGGVRWREPDVPQQWFADLWRVEARYQDRRLLVQLGRHVRLDPRGFLRLDGASFRYDNRSFVGVRAWGGRIWSPYSVQIDSDWVAGTSLILRPPGSQGSGASRTTKLELAYEARFNPNEQMSGPGPVIAAQWLQVRHRMYAQLAWSSYRGSSFMAFGEGQVLENTFTGRAQLKGGGRLGRSGLTLHGRAAWEGLKHHSTPTDEDGPRDFLYRNETYALAGGTLAWRKGRWYGALDGAGTYVIQPNAAEGALPLGGGTGRLHGGYQGTTFGGGLFASASAIGGSWLAGGGGEFTVKSDRVDAKIDTGLYPFHPIDGAVRLVWESRAFTTYTFFVQERPHRTTTLGLRFEGHLGADAQLTPWLSGGLAFLVRSGKGAAK